MFICEDVILERHPVFCTWRLGRGASHYELYEADAGRRNIGRLGPRRPLACQ